MKVKDIAALIEAFAPLSLQEEYDNSGLNVGSPEQEVTGILLCVDVTDETVDEALAVGADLIVSHHPLLFHPLKRIVGADAPQRIAARCIVSGISLYAAHTNLDSAPGGLSFVLGKKLGLRDMRTLAPRSADGGASGYGVVGSLADGPMPTLDFLERVRRQLRCGAIRYSAPCRRTVHRVALSTGSGASFIDDAIASGADLYMAADFKYNDFYRPDGRIVIADVGHFESEYCAMALLYDIITKKFANFAVHRSERSVNPVNYSV
ncbi:Nif3-like dinuclear metal center hexameric protein [uncultured Alistipes sp.]|uniref:Nif3-like dinuclear metal center hexameric protein n=1 Tax=uncultured Alistipes sp. TaxID=538949 RepID=UPI002635A118|nr:Nif3-like dinuclear metal center hexameric protein [uncultured Alistipes sp.]